MNSFPHKYVIAGICAVGGFHLLLRVLPDAAGDVLAVAVAIVLPLGLGINKLLRHGTMNVLEDAVCSVLEWIDRLKDARVEHEEKVHARRQALSQRSQHA